MLELKEKFEKLLEVTEKVEPAIYKILADYDLWIDYNGVESIYVSIMNCAKSGKKTVDTGEYSKWENDECQYEIWETGDTIRRVATRGTDSVTYNLFRHVYDRSTISLRRGNLIITFADDSTTVLFVNSDCKLTVGYLGLDFEATIGDIRYSAHVDPRQVTIKKKINV